MRTQNPSPSSGSVPAGAAVDDSQLQRIRYLLLEAERTSEPHLALKVYQAAHEACTGLCISTPTGKVLVANQAVLGNTVFGMAESYWRLNLLEDAAVHFREMIQLEPSDPRLARYWLAACLFGLRAHEELKELLARFSDDSYSWLYAQALYAFATDGDSEAARKLLIAAQAKGHKFLKYLLGEDQVLASRSIRLGSDASLHGFARLYLPAWRRVPGALAWTRQTLKIPLSDRSVMPMSLPLGQLLELPKTMATWQVGMSTMKRTLESEGTAWIVAVVCNETVLGIDIIDSQPTPAVVWSIVLKAMLEPLNSAPSVPGVIEVARPEFNRAWREMLAEVECECRVNYRIPKMQELLHEAASIIADAKLRKLEADFDPSDLPQSEAAWQIGLFHQPQPISNAKIGVVRPWSLFIMDKATQVVLCSELFMEKPALETDWEYACRVMQTLATRPQCLELMNGESLAATRQKASNCSIDCVLRDELPELDSFMLKLAVSFATHEKCSLAEGIGVTHEVMQEFYEVAAGYYTRAPWMHVPGDIPIEIRLASGETRYAVVMGRSGMTFGVTVYENYEELADLLCGFSSELPASKSVIFDEFMSLCPEDLYLVERYGWQVATPEAYPVAMSLSGGGRPTTPSKASLKLLMGVMRLLPDFLESQQQSKSYEAESSGFKQAVHCTWKVPRSHW